MKQTYYGACHCQLIRFSVTLDPGEAIVCDCSVCKAKGAIVVRVDEDDFDLSTPLDELSLYTFNKHIAKHYFCPTCGIHPFHRPRSYPDRWAINLRCLQGVSIDRIEPRQVFGSELD